jgi:D-xylose 1-dehydrogenase (NADP+, D-xylono-1,5-lactone-forming)
MNKTIVNWGILGCSDISDKKIIPAIKNSANARLYALASRSPEKLAAFTARHRPVTGYLSYEALLDDPEVDAVYISLPNSLHMEWSLKAAARKKHVLCEKPLACSPLDVLTMKKSAEANGVLLEEAFASRHSPLLHKVKAMIDEGAIGRLNFIEAHFCFLLDNVSNIRLMRQAGGGATYDIGCYNISCIRYLTGLEPIAVHAIGQTHPQTGVDIDVTSILEFAEGVKAVTHCSFNSLYHCAYQVHGDAGIITVNAQYNDSGRISIGLSDAAGKREIPVDVPDVYMLEVEQFGRCILAGEQPLVTLEDSYHNAVVIEKTLNATKGGEHNITAAF